MKRSIRTHVDSQLQVLYAAKKKEIRSRLAEFKGVEPSAYFYELIYCLCTPQSSAVNAAQAIGILKQHNFLVNEIDPEPILGRKESYIRFHRTKSKHLLVVKKNYPEIAAELSRKKTGIGHRAWLVENIKGMGWKEASHFLRNIGYRNLAILDRHILRNLVRFGVLAELPRALPAAKYLEIEEKFRNFANDIGIPMDELDLLFWCMETGQILK